MREQRGALRLAAEAGGVSGQRVAEAKGLVKAYGNRVLVGGFSTRILRGDRLAVVGPNGAGKSRVVKRLLGEIRARRRRGDALGAGLEIAYVDQAAGRSCRRDLTLREALKRRAAATRCWCAGG